MFDVGQGPVSFERRFEPVPSPPAPSLGATMVGGTPSVSKPLLVGGLIFTLGASAVALLKGEKQNRARNARMLGIVGAFGAMALMASSN